jgi:hypothetical protein
MYKSIILNNCDKFLLTLLFSLILVCGNDLFCFFTKFFTNPFTKKFKITSMLVVLTFKMWKSEKLQLLK